MGSDENALAEACDWLLVGYARLTVKLETMAFMLIWGGSPRC